MAYVCKMFCRPTLPTYYSTSFSRGKERTKERKREKREIGNSLPEYPKFNAHKFCLNQHK
jgi:hypothetical protein